MVIKPAVDVVITNVDDEDDEVVVVETDVVSTINYYINNTTFFGNSRVVCIIELIILSFKRSKLKVVLVRRTS